MKTKIETSSMVQNFSLLVENKFWATFKILRRDNGPEFILQSFNASKYVIHYTSCVEIAQQNVVVERKHQDLLNVTRALLFQANLTKCFWSYAFTQVAFIINKIPSKTLNITRSYKCLHHKPVDLTILKVFASLCFASILQHHRTKLDSRATKCIYLGQGPRTKGYALFDFRTRRGWIMLRKIFAI